MGLRYSLSSLLSAMSYADIPVPFLALLACPSAFSNALPSFTVVPSASSSARSALSDLYSRLSQFQPADSMLVLAYLSIKPTLPSFSPTALATISALMASPSICGYCLRYSSHVSAVPVRSPKNSLYVCSAPHFLTYMSMISSRRASDVPRSAAFFNLE